MLTLLTVAFLATTFGIIGSVLLGARTNEVYIGVTDDNMMWLIYLGLTAFVVAVISYSVTYIRTLSKVSFRVRAG